MQNTETPDGDKINVYDRRICVKPYIRTYRGEKRKEKNLTPLILPSVELQRKIVENLRDTLNKLAKDGKIKATKLLNDVGITLP